MSQPTAVPPDDHPGVRAYTLVCTGALALLAVALVLRRADAWAFFPSVLGGFALVFRWRAGPLLVLLAVVLLLWGWWLGTDPGWLGLAALAWVRRWWLGRWWAYRGLERDHLPSREAMALADLLLALSVAVYTAGHYRLQGLLVRVFPPQQRPKRQATAGAAAVRQPVVPPPRRSPEFVTARELVLLLLALPTCCGLASLFSLWLQQQTTDLPILDSAWQGILMLWLVGGGVLAAAALLRYLAHASLDADRGDAVSSRRAVAGNAARTTPAESLAGLGLAATPPSGRQEDAMRFWLRELAGWVLIWLGLAGFAISLRLLTQHYWIEAGLPSLIGFFLFRGGIHLLKVAIAARICLQAQDKLRPERAVPRPVRKVTPVRRR